MANRAVDLDGLPELVAAAIERQVAFWREYIARKGSAEPVELPVWQGPAPGLITREDFYTDNGT